MDHYMTSYIKEKPYHTTMRGKITELREKSINIQVLSDGECFLVVPRHRIPKALQVVDTEVEIFLTTVKGHFGVTMVPAKDEI